MAIMRSYVYRMSYVYGMMVRFVRMAIIQEAYIMARTYEIILAEGKNDYALVQLVARYGLDTVIATGFSVVSIDKHTNREYDLTKSKSLRRAMREFEGRFAPYYGRG